MGIDYYAGSLTGGLQSYWNWNLNINGQTNSSSEYVTTKTTDLAIDWVDAQTKPWFLWLAYSAPHPPFHLPPNDLHSQGALPADTRIMLTNSDDANAYPISGFTWLILYKNQAYDGRSKAQAKATLEFLDWMISADAQSVASIVNYAPLPEKAVSQAKSILRSVTYNGEALLN